MYIQIFILVKAALFLEGIQWSSLSQKSEHTKQGRYFDETVKKSAITASFLWSKY